MRKLFGFLLILAVVATSCKSEAQKEAEKEKNDSLVKAQARQKYLKAIDDANAAMHKDKTYDKRIAVEALRAYNDFTVMFPDDTLTPEFLLRAADLAEGSGNYQQAAAYLETIITKHKGYPQYELACFKAAFVYDEYLEDVNNGADRAKQLYQYVIDNYPGTDWAEQAKVMIQYVGRPNSDMINDIINKANKDSVKMTKPEKVRKTK